MMLHIGTDLIVTSEATGRKLLPDITTAVSLLFPIPYFAALFLVSLLPQKTVLPFNLPHLPPFTLLLSVSSLLCVFFLPSHESVNISHCRLDNEHGHG